jgi:hypothetical protein
VIATPGHTSDSLSYRIGDAVFVGDSIFMPDGGTARCDFPGGDAHVLYARSSACTRCRTTRACSSATTTARRARAARADDGGEQKRANIHVRADTPARNSSSCARKRDATLALPALILPAVQVNIRGGRLPPRERRPPLPQAAARRAVVTSPLRRRVVGRNSTCERSALRPACRSHARLMYQVFARRSRPGRTRRRARSAHLRVLDLPSAPTSSSISTCRARSRPSDSRRREHVLRSRLVK